jgi:hypothetical protein
MPDIRNAGIAMSYRLMPRRFGLDFLEKTDLKFQNA